MISVLRNQHLKIASSKLEELIWTLSPNNSAIKLTFVTTKRYMTEKLDSETFNTFNSIVKPYFVGPAII